MRGGDFSNEEGIYRGRDAWGLFGARGEWGDGEGVLPVEGGARDDVL